MAVDTSHTYLNKAERGNWDTYDDFKLKKRFGLQGLYKKYFIVVGGKLAVGSTLDKRVHKQPIVLCQSSNII